MADESAPGPLAGRRVLDLTTGVAGPAATQMLGFLGAEVIRVTSAMIPRIRATDDDPAINVLYLNKECVRLNLRDPRGLDLGRRLAAQCDIVVENQRPGSVARLGLGYEALRELRPDIIAISLSASGKGGPAEDEVGYAPNFVSRSGVGLTSGYAGGPPGEYVNWPDLISAHWLVFAVLYALIHRERTGEGQYLDLSANESLTSLVGDLVLDAALNGRSAEPRGNREPTMAPHAVYRCAGDYEWVSIAVATDGEWQALCEAMGRPELAEDPRFAGVLERLEHEQELDALIGEWTSAQPPGDLAARLQAAGVAAAPVLNGKQLLEDEHLAAQGRWVEVEHAILGKKWVMTSPWSLSDTPATVRHAAKLQGSGERYVYGELLGLSDEQIKELVHDNVIH